MKILIFSHHPKHVYLNILLENLKMITNVRLVRFRELLRSFLKPGDKFILHLQFPIKQHELLIIIFFAKLKQIPIIWTPHDLKPLSGKRKYFLFDFLLNLFDKIIVLSKANKLELINRGIKKEIIEVIPLPNLNFYSKFLIPKDEARKALGIDKNKIVFLQFGPFRKYKGFHLSAEAYNVLPKNIKKDTELVFAGKVWKNEKPDNVNLQNINTKFLGNKYLTNKEIGIIYSASDVILYPYLWITQSGSIFLALAFGKATIASSLGGIPEVISNGKEGFLIKPTADNIKKCIIKYVTNKSLAAQMGKNALLRSKKHSWGSITKQHIKLYASIAKSNNTLRIKQ